MTRPIEAQPRGDFSPLSCPCPYGAHRFLPIIAQDFSPGSLAGRPKVVKADKVCDQIFKEVIVYDQGLRVETLGYDKACKACPAGAHRSAGLKPRWYRPWEAWLKTLIALHRSPIRVFCCIMVYT